MKRHGNVEFKKVDRPAEFDAILAEMARHHDCRFLEVHGYAPFQRDVLKHDFTRALMNETDLVHISTLTVGGQLASAHVNIVHGKQVQLGVIAHNAAYSHFSPGKLHLLLLARMLMQAGYEQLDLTPGGEAYKERFANSGDHVHGLAVFPTPTGKALGVASMAIKRVAKRTIRGMGLNPTRLRSIIHRTNSRLGPLGAAASWLGGIRSRLRKPGND